ncbi:Regulatory protein BlaR1 [Phycisphaerales bacterium]|nr:Regulatory protein BlaR1 [Phycisphaerales bacterium]
MTILALNAVLACVGAGLIAALGLLLRRGAGRDPVLRYRVLLAHLLAIVALAPVQVLAPALGILPRGGLFSHLAPRAPITGGAGTSTLAPVPAAGLAVPGLEEASARDQPASLAIPATSGLGVSTSARAAGSSPGAISGWTLGAILYLAGVALWLTLAARRALAAGAVLRRARPVSDPRSLSAWHTLRAGVGPGLGRAARRARLLECESIASPACWGLLRPAILLPMNFAACRSDETLRCALHHELIHLRRADHVIAVVQTLLSAVFWPQPLLRRFGRVLEEDREASCDALVVRKTGRAREYAAALLDCCTPVSPTAVVAGISMGSGLPLRRRLHMLTHAHAPADRARTRLLGALSGAAILSLLTTTGLLACAAAPAHGAGARGGERSMIEVRAPEGERDVAGIMQLTTHINRDTGMVDMKMNGTLVEQETIASGHGDKTADGAFTTQELNVSLPEGSNLRATIAGEGISMKPVKEGTRMSFSRGELKVYDRKGVLRATVTTADADATMLLVMNDDNGEHNFVARASLNGENARVVIRYDTQTGRAAGEQETPPGEFRFYTQEADGPSENPWRLKMQWCHDLSKVQGAKVPDENPRWEKYDSYTVAPGDTPARIAERRMGNRALWREIVKCNGLDADNPELKPGMTLRIPRTAFLEAAGQIPAWEAGSNSRGGGTAK